MMVMRICSEGMKMCWFTGVRRTTAAAGSTGRVRCLWGVAWGGGSAGTEIVVVVVAGSRTEAVGHVSIPVAGDVNGVCSGVQG